MLLLMAQLGVAITYLVTQINHTLAVTLHLAATHLLTLC